ncbi:MAG: glyoxalase [Bacteroidetes bacterium]|nr:glyoxalase [Bacteroidota bacterium]MBS1975959.1 glyoxalase [Bacteroidota bacterium]
MESLTPNIFVREINKTIDYYQQLGFSVSARVPENGVPVWVMMNCGDVNIMFQTFQSVEGTLPVVSRVDGGSLLLYIKMKGTRVFYNRIKDHVDILSGLEKTFYGATEFSIRDLNNYMLTFAEDE